MRFANLCYILFNIRGGLRTAVCNDGRELFSVLSSYDGCNDDGKRVMMKMVNRLKTMSDEHPYKFGIAFMVIYLTWFVLLGVVDLQVVWYIECPLDQYIPFVKYMVVPYCMWFVWLAESLLHMAARESAGVRWRTWAPMFSGMLLCLLFCTLVPNAIDLRPDEVQGNDIFAMIVRLIEGVDDPKSVCPSLHVYSTIMMDMGVHRAQGYKHAWVRPAARILDILICCATVMLKQHSVVDVFWALVLAFALDFLAEYLINRRTPLQYIRASRAQ